MRAATVIVLLAWLSPGTAAAAPSETERSFHDGVDRLSVNVPTGGCTTRDSFAVSSSASVGLITIRLRRVVSDTCKGWFPEGAWIDVERRNLETSSGGKVVRVILSE